MLMLRAEFFRPAWEEGPQPCWELSGSKKKLLADFLPAPLPGPGPLQRISWFPRRNEAAPNYHRGLRPVPGHLHHRHRGVCCVTWLGRPGPPLGAHQGKQAEKRGVVGGEGSDQGRWGDPPTRAVDEHVVLLTPPTAVVFLQGRYNASTARFHC